MRNTRRCDQKLVDFSKSFSQPPVQPIPSTFYVKEQEGEESKYERQCEYISRSRNLAVTDENQLVCDLSQNRGFLQVFRMYWRMWAQGQVSTEVEGMGTSQEGGGAQEGPQNASRVHQDHRNTRCTPGNAAP